MILAALNDFAYKYATLLRVLRNALIAEGEALVCLAGIQRNHSETELAFHYGHKYIHHIHKIYMYIVYTIYTCSSNLTQIWFLLELDWGLIQSAISSHHHNLFNKVEHEISSGLQRKQPIPFIYFVKSMQFKEQKIARNGKRCSIYQQVTIK